MKMLNTYDCHEEAKDAESRLVGQRRLASERDDTSIIYNLFGIPTWRNFYLLKMYNLERLQKLLAYRQHWSSDDIAQHAEIISTLNIVSKNHELTIPQHWL